MTLTDRQKKAAAVGVGGLLLLVLMLARRSNAASTAATTTAADGSTIPTATGGGTGQADFSGDSTGNVADLSNTLNSGLGSISSGLETLGGNEQAIYSAIGDMGALGPGLANVQSSIDSLGGQLSDISGRLPATDGTPGTAAAAGVATAAAAGTAAKKKAATKAAAAKPETVVRDGKVYHYYDTNPKKPGYERKVYVRPASTAKRTPSRKPAAHKAAPVRARSSVGSGVKKKKH